MRPSTAGRLSDSRAGRSTGRSTAAPGADEDLLRLLAWDTPLPAPDEAAREGGTS
ncbi:hypothetical protein [Kitasatospora sp. NBC_01300]|uniref:hypothetical protein n=1 Tax=Kitasatospora sp. NBC_01300 TaxID=2903574 RepID=UPI00352E13A8|nr:hypothetical protein OG556_01235 [Kitasatospora sp. NBC_01300]